jgi:carboxymethylenebutenolidase
MGGVQPDIILASATPATAAVQRETRNIPIVFANAAEIAHEHIYWDQACVLEQIGLLDSIKLPVTGARQAEALLKKSKRESNADISR